MFRPDWKAFRMWREESRRRERQRLRDCNALKPEKPVENSEINMLYPLFSEVWRNPMGLDLESVSPAPPPYPRQKQTYTPVTTCLQAQLKLKRKNKSPCPTTSASPTAMMPMVEVSGTDGPVLVFRPWLDADIAEAMTQVCSPKDNLARWEVELLQFIKEYRLTMFELRRLMTESLGNDYHKIQGVFTAARMNRRLVHPDFDNDANNDFIRTVQTLIDEVQEKISSQIESNCNHQHGTRSARNVQSLLARLTSAFDIHSGLTRPNTWGKNL